MKIAEIKHDIETDTITIVIAKNEIWNEAIEAAAEIMMNMAGTVNSAFYAAKIKELKK